MNQGTNKEPSDFTKKNTNCQQSQEASDGSFEVQGKRSTLESLILAIVGILCALFGLLVAVSGIIQAIQGGIATTYGSAIISLGIGLLFVSLGVWTFKRGSR